ncbi:MAG: hypothetical protein DWQ49_09260, partial [Bacteroidetes bacterium]
MEKYIINNVEYTLEQISSAAKENGVDIDTYINDMGAQVVTDAVEDPVEKPEAVVEETAPATAVTGLQLENGSSEPVNYNQYSQEDIDSLKVRFDQGNFKTNQSEAYLNYKQTGNLDTSLLPEKYSRPINPETNKPFTAMEWVKNSLYNDDVMMEAASDFRSGEGAIDVMSASILRKLYGKENAEKMVAEDAKDGETFWTDGMSEEELTKGIKRVEELNNKRKQTASIVEGFKEGDLGQTAAGIFNAATQVYSSLKYAAGTAFTGWFTDFYAQNYINVNKAEAERKGVDFEEYITSGEDNVITPFATAYVQTALESFSAKKIVGKDVINKATKKVTERLVGKEAAEKALKTNAAKQAKETVLGTARAEAGTEIGQSAAEIYSETLAKTDDISEALAASVDFVFSEEGAEVALQGAFGGGIAKLTGKAGKKTLRAMRETRVAIDDNKTEQLVNELSELNKQLIGATDEDVKQGLESQIKEKSAELDGLVTKANGIVDGMTNNEIDEINNMSDLAQAQIQRVNALNAKKKAGDINNDEYLSALEGYKAEFVKAKNRIKGIVEEAADTTPEKVSQRTVKNADAINNAFNSETMHRVNEQTGKTELTDKGLDFFHNTVVPNMTDLVTRIGNRMFRENPEFGEKGYTKREFINDLIYSSEDVRNKASSLIGLVTSFNPERDQLLTTYITRNLENRSKRILAERVGDQATVGGTSIDTQEARQLEAEEITIPETKGPKFVKRLNLSDEIMNKARKAAVKALSTAKNVDDKKFVSDIVETINSEIFEDIRALVPKPKEREAFMQEFAETVWDAMPQSSMAKATRNETFKEWGMQAPTKEAFIDYFLGRDQEGLKTSTINDRAKKQLPQYLAKAIGAEYAEDLLKNDPEVRERFKLTQKQEVEQTADEIQGKTKEERELQNTAPKELEELRRLADEGDAGTINEILETERVSVDNTNSKNNYEKLTARQKAIVNFVKVAKIPSAILEKAMFANFGGEYTRRDGIQYYKLKNGKEVAGGTPEFKKALEEGLILPRQDRGGLFSAMGRKKANGERVGADGLFLEAYNAALKNDKLYPNLSSKRIAIPKGTRIDAAFLKKNAQQMKQNMDFLITTMKVLTDAVHKHNLPIQDAFLFITSSYQATEGFIKVAAPFKYISKAFSYGTVPKQMKSEMFREEHQPPASYIGKVMMWAIKNNKADIVEPFIRKNYYQTQLSKADDQKIDEAKLDSSMPKGYLIFENPIIRMAQSGINLNDQLNIETGQTMAQEFDAESAETPDAIAASNEVVKEKLEDNIETLIDRAIGKLEDYLGPKGALQANFAAVPINILIGGLRATKLAYRGSKNLAKALEAGYKKVQDYMSQQEWLDFTKQAVTEVKKEPTGKTIALAIANENAIKNEQNRINKLNVLNEAQAKKI